ncbi:MAG: class I SAM-dependent methyltransferase [Gemmatimonadota bacterium]
MDPDYLARYAELYRGHWWWRARETLVVEKIRRMAPVTGWERALDIGCGDGLFLPELSRFAETVEGLEAEESTVAADTSRRYKIHIGRLDERFRPGTVYDLVSMLDVLEHILDAPSALASCRQLMAPKGVLVLTVPAFQGLWTSHDDLNLHQLRYTRRGLCSLVEEAGFEVSESRYFFHWLIAPKWIVARVERILGSRLHQAKTPPQILNSLLYGLSRLEQSLLGPFRWLPGTSIFLVARKE